LRSASNPESGTTTYGYDNDGNLVSMTAHEENQTGTATVATTYTYDNLNRLTGKSYSDGVTPSACFQYDQSSSTREIGRLTTEWTQTGTCSSSPPSSGVLTQRTFAAYDPLGRVTADEQCATLGNCGSGVYTLNYGYDQAGDITSFNNGLTGSSYLSFTSQYNTAGRLAQVNGPQSPGGQYTSLFVANGYTPAGALSNAQIGVGGQRAGHALGQWRQPHHDRHRRRNDHRLFLLAQHLPFILQYVLSGLAGVRVSHRRHQRSAVLLGHLELRAQRRCTGDDGFRDGNLVLHLRRLQPPHQRRGHRRS